MYSAMLLGLAVAIAAPAVKDKPKAEPPSIVGEWDGVKAVSGGREKPVPAGGIVFVFAKDGTLTVTESGRNGPGALSYELDAKKSPAQIDLTPPAGKADSPMLGIFKIEGDTLTMCLADGKDSTRPTQFESPAGTHSILMTLKRAKKK